ncbi:30S ribosome-binding factor RbfA [uncultured Anaerofustis sp.]|uniref:30S ribosome-binding factor RbfA n=1 Tax=uncultured Anaerofustis sp. TaxID=904996 RepID=UPI0025DD159C|nr:30S ribosome-binding factor RbfA [uncultured Anaerofustis sp.]
MGYRIERVNELIKNELSLLIELELNDPRLKEAIISVVRVKATPDLKYAKVYVSVMGENNKKEEIIGVLDKAKGFLRKSIAKVLNTRNTPELIFELDNSLDYAMHIDEVLANLDIKDDEYDR